jgi:flagellar biosynthesis protein FliP
VTGETIQLALQGDNSVALKVFFILTALSFAPALLISMTSFTRTIIVLSFLRQALGTQQLPPNQVLIGISLFMTFFVMGPTTDRIYEDAAKPFMEDEIGYEEAAVRAKEPLEKFMLQHTTEEDLRLFYSLAGKDRPLQGEAIPFTVIVPAFMLSELTTAFRMGLSLFIPMLLIDLLVAALLMALGMMMMPPTMVSLPLKIGIFVLADGWYLVVGSLAGSFF